MRKFVLAFAISSASLFSITAAADERAVVALWPNGAPGSEARLNEPEKKNGNSVSNIHHPSLTLYLPPKGQATGCGVIVTPGGGHRNLVMSKEGYEIAAWLADHGIAAFVLKNRLANDDANPPGAPQPYNVDRHALADAQRALQLVRSRAAEWNVDPAKLGIIGFSAGGEVALLAATHGPVLKADPADVINRQNPHPDFFGLIYPGGLTRPDITLTKETPPAFLTCGYGDRPTISESLAEFYLKCKKAGVNAELHIYSGAEHGFGILKERNAAAATWIARFNEWLIDRKFIPTPKP